MKHKSGLAMIFGELEAMSRVEQHPLIVSLHLAYHDRYEHRLQPLFHLPG
jgi:hypothetical protein